MAQQWTDDDDFAADLDAGYRALETKIRTPPIPLKQRLFNAGMVLLLLVTVAGSVWLSSAIVYWAYRQVVHP